MRFRRVALIVAMSITPTGVLASPAKPAPRMPAIGDTLREPLYDLPPGTAYETDGHVFPPGPMQPGFYRLDADRASRLRVMLKGSDTAAVELPGKWIAAGTYSESTFVGFFDEGPADEELTAHARRGVLSGTIDRDGIVHVHARYTEASLPAFDMTWTPMRKRTEWHPPIFRGTIGPEDMERMMRESQARLLVHPTWPPPEQPTGKR